MPGVTWDDDEKRLAVDLCREWVNQGRSLKTHAAKEIEAQFNARRRKGRPKRTYHAMSAQYHKYKDDPEFQNVGKNKQDYKPVAEFLAKIESEDTDTLGTALADPGSDTKQEIIAQINVYLHEMDLAHLLQAHARVYLINEDQLRARATESIRQRNS